MSHFVPQRGHHSGSIGTRNLDAIVSLLGIPVAVFVEPNGHVAQESDTELLMRLWSRLGSSQARARVLGAVRAELGREVTSPDWVWTPLKRLHANGSAIRFDVFEPADLRFSLDFGLSTTSVTGVENVGELIEAFQLSNEERVCCDHHRFTLVDVHEDGGRTVVYRDAETEVRIPRRAYDRICTIVADLIGDPRVQSAFAEASRRQVVDARAAAWFSSPEGSGA